MAGPRTELRPGVRLYSATCTAQVIVTIGKQSTVEGRGVLTCGGRPMTTEDTGVGSTRPGEPDRAGTLLGKRYRAPGGALEVLCVQQGTGALELDGVPLELVRPRLLPASD